MPDETESVLQPENPPAVDPARPAPAEPDPNGGNGPEVPVEAPANAPDPRGGALAPDPPADLADPQERERLREELTRLREEIAATRDSFRKMRDDLAEFRDLYPDRSPDSLPDAVWEDVRNGIPLCAAVALSERRRARLEEKAEAANRANASRAAGSVREATDGFLSAREVRAMSPAEVRENYKQIMLSMPSWQ